LSGTDRRGKLAQRGSFPTWFVSQIESDPDRGTFAEMNNVLEQLEIGSDAVTDFDRQVGRCDGSQCRPKFSDKF
jgi:hypothetical protein